VAKPLTLPKSPVEREESDELVYAAAVLILSEDLYPRKLEVIREYIQNASDALDDFISVSEYIEDTAEPVIKISIQGRSLLIFDNGIGMDEEEIKKLKRIAYSEKKVGEEAGYKGIGRLAGIAIADKLKVSSTSYGDPKLHHFEFRSKEMRRDISDNKRKGIQEPATKVINRHTEIWWTDIDPESHYTLVELRDIKESCSELLDPERIKEYIGDIGPVDFAPQQDFSYGPTISQKLRENVPDYSPKAIYLSAPGIERSRIYKPYTNQMLIAEPEFIEIHNPDLPEELIAYCWYATKGERVLEKIRPAGRIFSVDGTSVEQKRHYAGLAYKLFGFTIGDRTLPQRTLWTTALPRALWFTGEIHIVDKSVTPTTDRSNFVENEARDQLYSAAKKGIPPTLIRRAQQISDNRRAFDVSKKLRTTFEEYKTRLERSQIDRADLKTYKQAISESLEEIKKRAQKCKDPDILEYQREVTKLGREVKQALENPKALKQTQSVADVAAELKMPTKARKVFQIIMETLASYYRDDKEEYHRIAVKIYESLRKRY
jgi:hypothetical protein